MDLSIVEIIKCILTMHSKRICKKLDFSSPYYVKYKLILQYNEPDLDFITRLTYNHGIHFYEDSDTLYFFESYLRGSSKTRILSLNFSSNNINRPLRVVGDRIIRVARNINENIRRSKIIEVGGRTSYIN